MALMPGRSAGSSATDSTRRASTNTRGRSRRSDARNSSPVMRVAVTAGAFKGVSWRGKAHSARRRQPRHPGCSGGIHLAELHVLDLLFEVLPASIEHLV